jgi:hypothetical protein
MAAAALVLSLLDDKPVLILAPATLIWQWQEELDDKLGLPAAVWSTQKKCWVDEKRRPLTQRGDPLWTPWTYTSDTRVASPSLSRTKPCRAKSTVREQAFSKNLPQSKGTFRG